MAPASIAAWSPNWTRPRPYRPARSRHASPPSTAGASSRMIRSTSGAAQASRNSRAPVRSAPTGSACAPAPAAPAIRSAISASTSSATAANRSALSRNWWYKAPRVTPAARTISSVPTSAYPRAPNSVRAALTSRRRVASDRRSCLVLVICHFVVPRFVLPTANPCHTDCLYVSLTKHQEDPNVPHRTVPRRLSGRREQAHRRRRQRAVLRRRARRGGGPGALVADPVAGPRVAGSLGTGARGRADPADPGGDRARPGFRPVRGRRTRHSRSGRPDRAPRGRRPVPVRAQPYVPGGGGRHHRAGAGPGPVRAAGLCRRRLAHRGLVRPLVRRADPGPPVRRAVLGVLPRRPGLAAAYPALASGPAGIGNRRFRGNGPPARPPNRPELYELHSFARCGRLTGDVTSTCQPEGRSGMMGGLEPEGESVSVDTSVPHIA